MARSVQRARGGRLEEVRDAALTLFARNGYAATNMGDIAREVKLVAPSLYNHISSKHEVLRALCVTTMGEFLARQRSAMEQGDVVARLRAATERHVAFCAMHPREVVLVGREFIHLKGDARQTVLDLRKQYEEGFRSLIKEGNAAGVFEVPRPKLASYAIIEMGMAVAGWYRSDGAISVDQVAADYGVYALRVVGHDADLV